MNSKIKKSKLWILSASILGLGSIVLTTVQCSDDIKVEKVIEKVEEVIELEDKALSITNLPTEIITSGNKVDGGSVIVAVIHPDYKTKVTYTLYKGTKYGYSANELKGATLDGLKSTDYVWVVATALTNYKWPTNLGAWSAVGVNNKQIEKDFVLDFVHNKKISITNLQDKRTLETRRWSGIERVDGTMKAYTLPNDIFSKANVKYYQGDDTDTVGREIVDLSSHAFINREFVWIRLVAKGNYGWPRVADITAKGWSYGDGATIQIKLTVKGLKTLLNIAIPSGLPNTLTFEKRSDTGWTLKNPNIVAKPEDYQIQWSKTIDPDNFGTVISIDQIENLDPDIHQYIWIKITIKSTVSVIKTFKGDSPSGWNYLDSTKKVLIFKQHLRPLVEFQKISFFDAIKKSLSLPDSMPNPKINDMYLNAPSALRSKDNLSEWPLITYSQYTLQMFVRLVDLGWWIAPWTKYSSAFPGRPMSIIRRPYLIAWDFTIKLTSEEKTKKLKKSQRTFVFGKHVVFVSLQARSTKDFLNQLSPDIPRDT